MSAPSPSHLSRRATLGAAAIALVATGCDLDPRSESPPANPPQVEASGSDSDDSALVRAAQSELTSLVELLELTAVTHPALGELTRRLSAVHSTHLGLLDGDPSVTDLTAAPPSVSPGIKAAYVALRKQERRLQSRLIDWSVEAQSGALARLLAAMAAAVAQQVALWPDAPRSA